MSIEPFTIEIPQAQLDDLSERLHRTRFSARPCPETTGRPACRRPTCASSSPTGATPTTGARRRPRSTRSRSSPPRSTGQRIHFVHVRSAEPDALPLVLTHGWPGSYRRVPRPRRAAHRPGRARRVRRRRVPRRHPVAARLRVLRPGARERLGRPAHIGRAWAELMSRLGYDRYGVQGGDIGAAVSPEVARVAPEAGGRRPPQREHRDAVPRAGADELASLTDLERDRLRRIGEFMQ